MTNEGQAATLLAVHIPKAAGTTLRHILERQYPPGQIFRIQNDIPGDRKRLQAMPEQDKRQLRAVFGHMCWGWHEALAKGQPYQYLTILRDPVERVLSLYAYCRTPGHYLHDEVQHMNLLAFVQSGVTRTVDNGMVRQLCGADAFLRAPYADMALDAVTDTHLEAAKANVDACAVVGVAERFDELLHQCRRVLGWRVGIYEHANVTTWPRPRWGELDDATRQAVHEATALDAELYDYAKEVGA